MVDVLVDFWVDLLLLFEWMGEWCDIDDLNVWILVKMFWNYFKGWCEECGIEFGIEIKFGSMLCDK